MLQLILKIININIYEYRYICVLIAFPNDQNLLDLMTNKTNNPEGNKTQFTIF